MVLGLSWPTLTGHRCLLGGQHNSQWVCDELQFGSFNAFPGAGLLKEDLGTSFNPVTLSTKLSRKGFTFSKANVEVKPDILKKSYRKYE